ncbi:hypothetical protein CO115_04315 [Candidatus Falkowbacteria bacterium CG_4_9_14_3_um_filter_36_9]|uniref:VIT family protein n=2 Tax=Candidatus Falkowiibacteriota TaxID=1752728 RepID=A0A1J4TB02_9BACT|nr:MAG: hypothetical protein AUJ27_02525 [Candidatus Falkowbacteria bacterium CG1_02_37_44]PIV52118.1 MAG: hypothetical protein COS18_00430 [Candidatus Falkowbacteria bacterium CG02_land_8_20_14_3_00_36_14]PIX12297.1 MAG: hypothetical protein COZ73_00430 [Candidatus Falkowbacteria bacterium CG_4_8_14_3_um_filter_36_11]PJA10916.1 MAG: hypothetical protein COX67_02495 [Candidatus Falkowbacteria bacterium CG_4_10_14_0_2_um_filter_36_22]PJB18547.1 MAG: hypothetical protein CO115_04315 [Candidatus F
MNYAKMKGFSFGLTSGIITTLGLIVGLHSGTHSTKTIIGGILIIAIADALSDALGIHISEESEKNHSTKEIWEATGSTFFSKFVFSLLFILPFIFFPLLSAIIISIIIGLLLIIIFSYFIAKRKNISPYSVVSEHLIIAVLVIVITHYIGDLVAKIL